MGAKASKHSADSAEGSGSAFSSDGVAGDMGPGGHQSSGLTSRVSKMVMTFWTVVAIAGLIVALAGLSSLQHRIISDPGSSTFLWSIDANLPNLTAAHVLRFDWFTLFLELTVLGMLLLVLFSKARKQAAVSVVGFLAVVAVLQILSADHMYNIRAFRNYSSATCAFTGFILTAAADLALMYHFGLQPLL